VSSMAQISRRPFLTCLGIVSLVLGSLLSVVSLSVALAATPSDSRAIAISLRELPRDANTPEARRLFGATILRGFSVFTDAEGPNVVLLAVRAPDSPPLQLDDFLVAWLNVSTERQWPGCSIDPRPETIRRLNEIERWWAIEERPDRVDALMRQWAEVARAPQRVVIFGVSRDTHFAQVMVEADYHLKDLVHGRVKLPGMRSLFEIRWQESLARLRDPSAPPESRGSISRFWFNAGQPRIYRDENTVILDECPVVLKTEEEAAFPDGTTRGLGRPEPRAQDFAEEFTRSFEKIAEKQPIYRELQGLYRMVAIAHALYQQEEPPNLQEMIDNLVRAAPIRRVQVPSTLPGKVRTEKAEIEEEVPGGILRACTWVLACGGVTVNPRVTPECEIRTSNPRMRAISELSFRLQPNPRSVWWDVGPSSVLYLGRSD